MKTEEELNKEILETRIKIQENYPELLPFADEMTITLPCKQNPEINASILKDYRDSLKGMATEYAKSTTKHILFFEQVLQD